MNSFDAISISIPGLTLAGDRDEARIWETPDGDPVGLFHFALPPDIPAALDDPTLPLLQSRSMSRQGVAAIEVVPATVGGCSALRQIVKLPQKPRGMMYLGSVTFPFRDFSFVLKIQCPERGMTGVRDAIIFDVKLNSGEVKFEGERGPAGWMQDPYDPERTEGLARNLADDEQYDERFPDHPLSRARRFLRAVESGVTVAENVRGAPPFSGPVTAEKKPWWRLW